MISTTRSVVGLFMTPIRQWKRLDRVMVDWTCLLHIGSFNLLRCQSQARINWEGCGRKGDKVEEAKWKGLCVNDHWQQMEGIMMETAQYICGMTKRPRRHKETWWWNEEVAEAVREKSSPNINRFSNFFSLTDSLVNCQKKFVFKYSTNLKIFHYAAL